jgi:hypothetical protein
MSELFEINNLQITFDTKRGPLQAVRGVSLSASASWANLVREKLLCRAQQWVCCAVEKCTAPAA